MKRRENWLHGFMSETAKKGEINTLQQRAKEEEEED